MNNSPLHTNTTWPHVCNVPCWQHRSPCSAATSLKLRTQLEAALQCNYRRPSLQLRTTTRSERRGKELLLASWWLNGWITLDLLLSKEKWELNESSTSRTISEYSITLLLLLLPLFFFFVELRRNRIICCARNIHSNDVGDERSLSNLSAITQGQIVIFWIFITSQIILGHCPGCFALIKYSHGLLVFNHWRSHCSSTAIVTSAS